MLMQHPDASTSLPSSVFPFDADIVDCLLTTLPDIHSLESFVLSSKFVYDVFQSHRTCVLKAVVSNHLGPVVPQAMCLVKVMVDVRAYWHGWLAPVAINKLPKESDFRHDFIVTMREAHIIADNHDVVQELEGLYSWRQKDPRSTDSQLTQKESARFQRAMYRVWFVSAMYGRPAPPHRVDKSKSKRLKAVLKEMHQMQLRCLQSYPSTEFALLLEAWNFLSSIADWACRAEYLPQQTKYRSLNAYFLWSGPKTTLQAFHGKVTSIDRKMVPSMAASYEQFPEAFSLVAASALKDVTGILDSPEDCVINGLRCDQCTRLAAMNLWGRPNWAYLRGILPPSKLFDLLDIPWWNSFTDADSLEKLCRSVSYAQLVEEVFALRSKHYKRWRSEAWLCTDCLCTFLRDNIEPWCHSRN
ncbi:hypothetical protein F5I97DRAFT_1410341 [Phlebopus sp. FC_14]|nr:hypothetical protein F5I97DRAFT_1410341 [Phlebopus sp. FC_14]